MYSTALKDTILEVYNLRVGKKYKNMKFLKIIKRFWLLFLIGFVVGGAIVFFTTSANAKKAESNKYTVKRDDLTEVISLSGQVDAKEKVSLRFQTSGLLAWVGVKEGDTVKKYQSLASLDRKDLQNRMSQLLNTYSKTRNDFDQANADNTNSDLADMTDEARATAKRSLNKYQMDLNNSVLYVESQSLALRYATLWTPIEGVVTNIEAPLAGQNITPASATFEVINPKTWYFSATADQTEVVSFVTGMEGKMTLDSFPDKEFSAIVESISIVPKSGESGTVYEIKIEVDIAEMIDKIRYGMTGDVSFVLKDIKDVLVVPESYLKKTDGKYFVSVMENGKMIKKEVDTSNSVEGMVEITGGLNEKDVIYNQSK